MSVRMSTQNPYRFGTVTPTVCQSHGIESHNAGSSQHDRGGERGDAAVSSGQRTADTVPTATATRPAPARPRPIVLPPWRVLLHNDDVNDMDYVVETIQTIVRVNRPTATRCMIEAHRKGVALVTVTHRERAEFLADQLRSKRLTVTIEPER